MRELNFNEVYKLEECLRELAAHHNEVSELFKGQYPKSPFAETLASFENDLKSGISKIFVIDTENKISGFCKTDINGKTGTIDYLIVLKEARSKGYGKLLLDRAAEIFRQNVISVVEVRVVYGNDAVSFYEKYGFRKSSYMLRLDL